VQTSVVLMQPNVGHHLQALVLTGEPGQLALEYDPHVGQEMEEPFGWQVPRVSHQEHPGADRHDPRVWRAEQEAGHWDSTGKQPIPHHWHFVWQKDVVQSDLERKAPHGGHVVNGLLYALGQHVVLYLMRAVPPSPHHLFHEF
jgi:hypothetical protein